MGDVECDCDLRSQFYDVIRSKGKFACTLVCVEFVGVARRRITLRDLRGWVTGVRKAKCVA